MDANKLNTQEQEKAKFSFAGATLYGINAVIGSGIFLLPQKIYKGLGPASLAVIRDCPPRYSASSLLGRNCRLFQ